MTATVRLLGRPGIESNGVPVRPPRGHKPWALLAQLLLDDRPPSRQRLVTWLFADAADPLAALRWNIAELRRALQGVASVEGDPVRFIPADSCVVDVHELTDGTAAQALALPGFGQELLEGISPAAAPAFDAWLAAERCRITACAEAVLVERALDLLAAGSPAPAARLAARAVAMDPLNPDHHAVLIRSLTAAGDAREARRQAERCTDLFRRELGCAPPAEVLAAVTAGREPAPGPPASAATVHSYLDAGRASAAAGAVTRSIDQLERAAALSEDVGDPALRAAAFVALAGARVHGAGERGTAVRGLLQEAVALARASGAADVAAAACRELAFLALQRGQQDRAKVWLQQGEQVVSDDGERARLLGVRGMCLTDGGDSEAALAALHASVRLARGAGDARQEAWSLSMVGRVHVLRRAHAAAAEVLDTCLELIRTQGWTSLQPWPATFRAEAALGLGDRDTARALLDSAWVLAAESGDHCWLTTAAHGQALLALTDGDLSCAATWCDRGLAPSPWYLWPHARLLDLACAIALRTAPETAGEPIRRLTRIAAAGGMRDLLRSAQAHRARAAGVTAGW